VLSGHDLAGEEAELEDGPLELAAEPALVQMGFAVGHWDEFGRGFLQAGGDGLKPSGASGGLDLTAALIGGVGCEDVIVGLGNRGGHGAVLLKGSGLVRTMYDISDRCSVSAPADPEAVVEELEWPA
jgi:hypothetical protein